MKFDELIQSVQQLHQRLSGEAVRAINLCLTLRNWLIGWHIQQFEQRGEDRAAYGERLIEAMADRLRSTGWQRCDSRELRRYRQFYQVYPQIRETVSPELRMLLPSNESENRETSSPKLGLPGRALLKNLSFSHFAELIEISDPLKRAFYEFECAKGHWSVRELKRQINTLFYHRLLKCHVLFDLKVDGFNHEYLGQLNTYVHWFIANELNTGDNPPVGILLCTAKNQALVKYALAGMDNQLFVSKYLLQLPEETEIKEFLERQLREASKE